MCHKVLPLVFLLATIASAGAQTQTKDDSDAIPVPAKSNSSSPAHHVWSNEDVQQIQGGISVVGNSPNSKAAAPANRIASHKPFRPPVQFRATTIDGDVVSSDQLEGRPVLIQFWATWCPHCRADQAAVDHIARMLGSAGLIVLAVDDAESEAKVRKYLQTSPRAVPIILGKDSNIQKLVDLKGYPTYVAISPEGQIVGTDRGEIHEDGMIKLLTKAGLHYN
jgi:thiol-disulfide isomerase/thioredoxin